MLWNVYKAAALNREDDMRGTSKPDGNIIESARISLIITDGNGIVERYRGFLAGILSGAVDHRLTRSVGPDRYISSGSLT